MFILILGLCLGAQLITAVPVTKLGQQYKDSFYFAHSGVKYLIVSDLSRGGVSLLRSVSNSDNNFEFFRSVVQGNHFAPTVVPIGGDWYNIYTTKFAFDNSFLYLFKYNVVSGEIGPISTLNLSGGQLGMTDPTVWYENNRGWYLMGAKWQAGVLGCRLQWARADKPQGPFSFPQDLLDQNGVRVDWAGRGKDVNWVVQAPIWSYWDHNGDGNHQLYWSIGPSDPKNGAGQCEMWVKAVRRGDIKFRENTPWVDVWGREGGDGDIMSSNMDCYHLTHPDFTQDGRIRATSMRDNRFCIVSVGSF